MYIVGMKVANYHYGPQPNAVEQYLGGIDRPYKDANGEFPPPVVTVVDSPDQAERFADEYDAETGCTDVLSALKMAACHHDPGYVVYPVKLV